jgi:AcrR family transcriptional regulator
MEKDARIRKSKSLLKQSLLTLMKKKSFIKITIKELCEYAGLNRSTFYSNYEEINELLLDVHLDVFHEMSASMGDSWKAPYESSYQEHLESIIGILKYYQNNKSIIQLLLSNNYSNLFEKHLTDYYMKLYVQDNATYIDRYIFLYHTIGGFSLVYQWMRDKSPCLPEELAELIYTMSNSAREHMKLKEKV